MNPGRWACLWDLHHLARYCTAPQEACCCLLKWLNNHFNDESSVMWILGTVWACESEAGATSNRAVRSPGLSITVAPDSAALIRKMGGLGRVFLEPRGMCLEYRGKRLCGREQGTTQTLRQPDSGLTLPADRRSGTITRSQQLGLCLLQGLPLPSQPREKPRDLAARARPGRPCSPIFTAPELRTSRWPTGSGP